MEIIDKIPTIFIVKMVLEIKKIKLVRQVDIDSLRKSIKKGIPNKHLTIVAQGV